MQVYILEYELDKETKLKLEYNDKSISFTVNKSSLPQKRLWKLFHIGKSSKNR